ncbi:DUF3644 domain-containing protein [Spirochaeta cellobiosiphila]|uniref:DUF3644 domain-containing protein n=1 Tax=Spirochaeta cellobiosiphila TaxID=504483 RepID=UPI00041CCB74|nr:DUF3644 domain-containing protein [Spirochaeta cellobiosiphila]
MSKRNRRIGSIKAELIKKSREATLAAVQIFNNPNISFKAESYVILMIIGWTYLMHAYYRSNKIEYRYYSQHGTKRIFDKTKKGAYKYWELERCLNDKNSPIDIDTKNNLVFLIGLRHEIEHQMTTRIDDLLSARFQACCLNYNHYIKELFGSELGIENYLSFSLQFSTIDTEQKDLLSEHKDLPANIQSYIQSFDQQLSESEYSSQRYAYRILFIPKTANRKGQADRVIEFVKSDSEIAEKTNKEYAVFKETEKPKFIATQVIDFVKKEGFPQFKMHNHTKLWKERDAKNPNKGYGVMVADKYWRWYSKWIDEVIKYCKQQGSKFK